MNPKQVDEWTLTSENDRKIIKKEIRAWINHFKKHANEQIGTIRNLDFKNNNVLFFTNCQDLIQADDPNKNIKIQRRKRNVFHQLFLKYLINDQLQKSRLNFLASSIKIPFIDHRLSISKT